MEAGEAEGRPKEGCQEAHIPPHLQEEQMMAGTRMVKARPKAHHGPGRWRLHCAPRQPVVPARCAWKRQLLPSGPQDCGVGGRQLLYLCSPLLSFLVILVDAGSDSGSVIASSRLCN